MPKKVGIVGVNGRYGQWLAKFFITKMGCHVFGIDTENNKIITERLSGVGKYKYIEDKIDLVSSVNILIFSVPIELTASIIQEYALLSKEKSKDQLWMDITSIHSMQTRKKEGQVLNA